MADTTQPTKPKDLRRRNPKQREIVRKRVLAMSDHCAICGRPVDKTLKAGLPLSPEVDEIIPVSRGGDPLDLDNCQLTHKICNQRKSNKMATDYITGQENPLPVSKNW